MKTLPSGAAVSAAGKRDSILLQLFKEKEKQRLTNAYSVKPGKAELAFNLPVKALSIIPLNDSSKISVMEFTPRMTPLHYGMKTVILIH